MPFDPISWAIGYAANKGVNSLLSNIFNVGAYGEIRAAAVKWASGLPENISTPSEALFDIASNKQFSSSRNKLKQAILELHKIPTEQEWFDALIESWEFKRDELGVDANAFFLLERSVAEEHLRGLAYVIFAACASVLKYSQPLLIREIREIGITQSLMLQELKSFRSPLNNLSGERNEKITLQFDPTHIEDTQLQLLNEVLCVDSPAEVIAGRYRTHELWVGPDGCNKEDAYYIPLEAKYIPQKITSLLMQWNRAAVDLAKRDTFSVIASIASFHHKFLEIHPFPDGNGRMARAILDLQVRNFTPARSPLRLKSHLEYYLALKAADDGNVDSLKSLISSILQKELGSFD